MVASEPPQEKEQDAKPAAEREPDSTVRFANAMRLGLVPLQVGTAAFANSVRNPKLLIAALALNMTYLAVTALASLVSTPTQVKRFKESFNEGLNGGD